ncbi:MAG: hypothetical protein RL318_2834, partial [Fibrobacterota bacterium]
MSWFRNLRIGSKITSSFGVLFLIVIGLGGVALNGVMQLHGAIETIAEAYTPSIIEAGKIRAGLNHELFLTYSHLQEEHPEDIVKIEATFKEEVDSIEAAIKRYTPLLDDPEESKLFEEFQKDRKVFEEARLSVLVQSRQGLNAKAYEQIKTQLTPAFEKMIASIAKCAEINARQTRDAGLQGASLGYRTMLIIIVFAVLALIAVLFLRGVLVRLVASPLEVLSKIAERIANGDLSQRVTKESQDEIGDLQAAFSGMSGQLSKSLGGIQGESQSLAAAAEQMSVVAADLDKASQSGLSRAESLSAASVEMNSSLAGVAVTTEQSSANLERIAASIEEMAASISEIARSAERSRTSA